VAEEEVDIEPIEPTFEHTEVGDQLRLAADRLGFNKNQLSKLSGVSRRHITLAFLGANISLSILKKLARVLDLTIITLGDLSLRARPRRSTPRSWTTPPKCSMTPSARSTTP